MWSCHRKEKPFTVVVGELDGQAAKGIGLRPIGTLSFRKIMVAVVRGQLGYYFK